MKGQTAIEYLMTYGWAILIILIVAGVLAYYGIFAPSGFLAPTARGFGQIQVLNPWDIAATDGAMKLNLQNRVGGEITISSATVTIGSTTIDYDATGTPNIASGVTDIVSFSVNAGSSWIAPAPNAGESYTATVTIQYTYNTESFSTSGTISGTYS